MAKKPTQSNQRLLYILIASFIVIVILLAIPLANMLRNKTTMPTQKTPVKNMTIEENNEVGQKEPTLDVDMSGAPPEVEYDIFGVRKRSTTGVVRSIEGANMVVDTIGEETYTVSITEDTYISGVEYDLKDDGAAFSSDADRIFNTEEISVGDIIHFSFSIEETTTVNADEIIIL